MSDDDKRTEVVGVARDLSPNVGEGLAALRRQVESGRDLERKLWQQKEIDKAIRKGLTLAALEELQARITAQNEALVEDGHEVEGLKEQVLNAEYLSNPEKREEFFGDVEQRLTVLLVLLIRSNRLKYQSFSKKNPNEIPTILRQLNSRKDKLTIGKGRNKRGLLQQEKDILEISLALPGHKIVEVKEGWDTLSKELIANVQAMDFSTELALADMEGREPKEREDLLAQAQEFCGKAKKEFDKLSPTQKTVAVAAAALGSLLVINWLFNKFSEKGGKGGGFIEKLGIIALIGTGLYIASKFIDAGKLWKKLGMAKDMLGEKLSESDFLLGLMALKNGDRKKAGELFGKSADRIFEMLGIGGEEEPKDKTKKGVIRAASEAVKESKEDFIYTTVRDSLIGLYCFSGYEETDIVEIKNLFNSLKGKKISEIPSIKNDDPDRYKKSLSALTKIDSTLTKTKPKNAYIALKIIRQTHESYKKYYGDVDMEVGEFLKLLANNSIHKINTEMQSSIRSAITQLNLNAIDFTKIESSIEDSQGAFIDKMCQNLGVDLEGLDSKQKSNFLIIAVRLYKETNLTMDAQSALDSLKIEGIKDQEVLSAAKEFFTETKKRTEKIIPRIVRRFNIAKTGNAETENLIQDNLTMDKLSFGQAVRLNVVTYKLDLGKDAQESGAANELALLYVTLSCLPKSARNKYISELTKAYIRSPSEIKLPSLKVLQPFFEGLKSIGAEKLKDMWKTFLDLTAAYRPTKDREALAEQLRHSSTVEFSTIAAIEGVGATLQLGIGTMNSLMELTEIDKEQWQHLDTLEDFLSLMESVRASLVYSENEKGEKAGVLYLAGQFFYVKPVGAILDSIATYQKGDTKENTALASAAKVYATGAAPAVVLFGGEGLLKPGVMGKVKGVLKGIGKGLAAPITMPAKGTALLYRGGRYTAESAQTTFNVTRNFLRWGDYPGHNINIMMRDAKYFREYLAKSRGSYIGPIGELKRIAGGKGVESFKRLFFGNWNQRMMEKYGTKFRNRYLNFFNIQLKTASTHFISLDPKNFAASIDNINEAAYRMQLFMGKITSSPKYLAASKDASKMKELIKETGGAAGLIDDETKALITRLGKRNGLKNFCKNLDEAKGYIPKGKSLVPPKVPKPPTIPDATMVPRQRPILEPTMVPKPKPTAVPTKTRGVWKYRDATMKIKEKDIGKMVRELGVTKKKAVQALCEKEWAKLLEQAKKAPKQISDSVDTITYLYKGQTLTLTKGELLSKTEDLKKTKVASKAKRAAAIKGQKTILRREAITALFEERLPSTSRPQIPQAPTGARSQATTAVSEAVDAARVGSESSEALKAGGKVKVKHIRDLKKLAEAGESAKIAERLKAFGLTVEELDEVGKVLKNGKNWDEVIKVMENTGKIKCGAGLKGLAKAARFAGPVFAAVGVGFNAWEAKNAFAAAREITNNPELRETYVRRGLTHTGVGAGELAIDVLALTGKIGGAASLGAVFVFESGKHIYTSALDARAEKAMTKNEYFRMALEKGKSELFHKWYTRGEDADFGLAAENLYFQGLSSVGHEFETKRSRYHTRLKIIEALLLLDGLSGNFTSAESFNEYNKYRLAYLRSGGANFNVDNFQDASLSLERAKFVGGVMMNRKASLLFNGEKIDLSEKKYDADSISSKDIIKIFNAALQMNSRSLREVQKGSPLKDDKEVPSQFHRLGSLDRNYINQSINLILAHLMKFSRDEKTGSFGDARLDRLDKLSSGLINLLKSEGYEFSATPNIAISDDLIKEVEEVFFNEKLSDRDLKELVGAFTPNSKGVAALYTLAKYYGYKGDADPDRMKEFFTEENKHKFALYYLEGEGWMTNRERTSELKIGSFTTPIPTSTWYDVGHGPHLDVAMKSVIEELKENPDTVLGSTLDNVYDVDVFGEVRDDLKKRQNQVTDTAGSMEQAYNSFVSHIPKTSKEDALEPLKLHKNAEQQEVVAGIKGQIDKLIKLIDSINPSYVRVREEVVSQNSITREVTVLKRAHRKFLNSIIAKLDNKDLDAVSAEGIKKDIGSLLSQLGAEREGISYINDDGELVESYLHRNQYLKRVPSQTLRSTFREINGLLDRLAGKKTKRGGLSQAS